MAKQVIVSKQGSLNWRDWVKTAALTVGTPMLFEIQKVIDTGSLNINWKNVAMIGLSAGITYIVKQLIGKPKVTTTYDTNAKAVEVAEDIKK